MLGVHQNIQPQVGALLGNGLAQLNAAHMGSNDDGSLSLLQQRQKRCTTIEAHALGAVAARQRQQLVQNHLGKHAKVLLTLPPARHALPQAMCLLHALQIL